MSLPAGTRLGSYEILSSLGAGGMGEVYRARDPRLDREVAIKVLPAALAGDPAALARFEREATSVAKLSHPNILSIYEFANADGTAFVVMELVDGETLRARLATGALPVRRAVGHALQIARGIAAAHARGIVHRDLKPENVMITRDDQVKILDFGLAKPIDPAGMDQTRGVSMATSAGTVLGTFGYMAPEQVRGLAVDQRTDMFAFGAVLYEMLSGQRAFAGETAADSMSAVLTKEPPDLDGARLAIPPSLDCIVRRCLEKSPDLRFQSANDLGVRARHAVIGVFGRVHGLEHAAGAFGPGDVHAEGGHTVVAAVDGGGGRRAGRGGGLADARRRATHRALVEHVHPDHGGRRRGDVAKSVTRRLDGRLRGPRQRQLGHLRAARWRPHRDAARQRSAARRTLAGLLT